MTDNEKADEWLEMSNAIEQVVREFIEMMEEEYLGSPIMDSPEYEALKALLEDESAKEKTYNVRGEHNGYIITKDGRRYYEVLEDKPDAERWKPYSGVGQPVPDDVIIEVKYADGEQAIAPALDWREVWTDIDRYKQFHPASIIAYRLVKEPSQEKKPGKQWKCKCTICGETKEALDGECACDGSKKKPRKQTFRQYLQNIVGEDAMDDLDVTYVVCRISDYLAQD
ncbi:MAG: hypothetical protein V3V81_07495 [Candidatus Bathyarchaeia archaeon]